MSLKHHQYNNSMISHFVMCNSPIFRTNKNTTKTSITKTLQRHVHNKLPLKLFRASKKIHSTETGVTVNQQNWEKRIVNIHTFENVHQTFNIINDFLTSLIIGYKSIIYLNNLMIQLITNFIQSRLFN